MKNSKILVLFLCLALISSFIFAQGRTETTVEEEVILTLPKLEKEEPIEEKEEVKLIPEEASPKKPKRRGRKKENTWRKR